MMFIYHSYLSTLTVNSKLGHLNLHNVNKDFNTKDFSKYLMWSS